MRVIEQAELLYVSLVHEPAHPAWVVIEVSK